MGSGLVVQCPQLSAGSKGRTVCLWRGLASAGTMLLTGEGQPPVWSNRTAGVMLIQALECGHRRATMTQFMWISVKV